MNKIFTKNNKYLSSKGFTLVETLIAVFILTFALMVLLTVLSNSYFSAKYAKNEITAMYLAQEAIDYIHNDRNTTAFQGGDWDTFLSHYGDTSSLTNCYDNTTGCYIDVFNWVHADSVKYCDPNFIVSFGELKCPELYFDTLGTQGFYNYDSNTGIRVPFKRQIHLDLANGDEELDITVTVEWQNGSVTRSQSLRSSLLKWR